VLTLCQVIRPVPRLCVVIRNKYWVLRGRVVSPLPNPQAGGPPIVDCPRLLIQYICSYPPYLEAFSSICKTRTRHAVLTVDPLIMVIITTLSFITLFVNRYGNWFFPLVRQFSFAPNQINKFMYPRMQCFLPAWMISDGILTEVGKDLITFQISISDLNHRGTKLWYKWLCCLYFCLPNTTRPCTFSSWQK
jgi:hypothetical protein